MLGPLDMADINMVANQKGYDTHYTANMCNAQLKIALIWESQTIGSEPD